MNDLALVALNPQDLAPTQVALGEWCLRKIEEIKTELADLQEHLIIAVSNGWKLRGLQASINRSEKRITYYDKIKDAVAAGYLIVPNFPVTVMAVRVNRRKQPERAANYEHSHKITTATPELLPAGDGRYVDDKLFTVDESYEELQPDGKTKTIRKYVSGEYDEPDFPFAAVKPAVLDAAQRAMALKVFDTIGVVQNQTGRDPIIVGQLIDPRGNDRRCTFFIAWWLNTADL